MIFKSIRLKEGFFERAIIFSEGVNLIHSEKIVVEKLPFCVLCYTRLVTTFLIHGKLSLIVVRWN